MSTTQLKPNTIKKTRTRKRLSQSEIFYKNEICKILEIKETAVRSYKAKHKFKTYAEFYREIKRRLFVASKVSEFLVDKTVNDVKDFFEGTYRARYEKATNFFTSLYCLDKSCKIGTRFYNNCLIVLQNIKLDKNPCNY